MPNPVNEASKIGSQRTYQNPNDPKLEGEYKDPVEKMSPEALSPLSNFPMAPAPKPFKSFSEG